MRIFAVTAVAIALLQAGCASTPSYNYVQPSAAPPATVANWKGWDCSKLQGVSQHECHIDNAGTEYSAPPPEKTYTAEDIATARALVDVHLANHLKDPISAMQYSLSAIVPCPSVALAADPGPCVCYEVNAKNSYGAYGGTSLRVVKILGSEPPFVTIEVAESDMFSSTAKNCMASMEPRDASRIHDLVRK